MKWNPYFLNSEPELPAGCVLALALPEPEHSLCRSSLIYDAAGRLTQADDTADPHRPIGLTYDPLDRLLTETTTLGTVTYTYDNAGRRTSMTVSGQAPVSYTYDANSRLRTITQAPLNAVDIQYDATNRRTLLTLPNGVSTEYQYDTASRLTALVYRNALGPLGDLQYTYDAAGNRLTVGGSFAGTLLPDAVASAAYDQGNRQLAFGDKTMVFDDNGNLVTLTDATGTTAFTWDARNRLAGLNSPATSAQFAYDGQGRRARRTVGSVTTQFQYDGLDAIREVGGAGDASYLRTLAIDEALVRSDSVDTVHFVADALGSTVALTTAAGSPTTTYTYEPFGRAAVEGTVINPVQYTGRENDGTGLYYFRGRYYHPLLQRFVSEDPIGFLGSDINYFAYVWNNPTGFVDPAGYWGTGIVGGGTIAGGLGSVGAAATASGGGGVFTGGPKGVNFGAFGSAGAFAGGPGYGPSHPSDNRFNTALGAFAGGGGGVFLTNATSAADLAKTTTTASLDIGSPAGLKISIQVSHGPGAPWIISVTAGLGIGMALSNLATNTWAYPRKK